MKLNSIEDTTLYQKLQSMTDEGQNHVVNKLIVMVKTLCGNASNRMKKSISLHPLFTVHDE